MEINELLIPETSGEMISTYRGYYKSFYLEMVRMSNKNLNDHVGQFIALVSKLARGTREADQIRAAIGVVALHVFGYRDFGVLSRIFDRLLPQTDLEYVKFTSWCAGQLLHHPGQDQSRYAAHLFERCVGWTNARGRRARPLAAAHLLSALATNAGSMLVIYVPTFQSIIWTLVSHQSTKVLFATADAIVAFTRAILRYGRSDLEVYYKFFTELAGRLLGFGDPISETAALLMYDGLINSYPSYFASDLNSLNDGIEQTVEDEPMIVQMQAYVVRATLSQVDPVQYCNLGLADGLFERTRDILLEFPVEIVKSLGLLCRVIPDFMEAHIDELKEMAKDLIGEPDSAFDLLRHVVTSFGVKALPLDQELLNSLLNEDITTSYGLFVVALANCEGFSEDMKLLLCERLENQLRGNNPLVSLRIVGRLPGSALRNHEQLADAIWNLARDEVIKTRKAVAKAAYNVARVCQSISLEETIHKLLELAVYDHSLDVRASILAVLLDNVHPMLATAECLPFLQIFVNDDATTIRKLAYRILTQLSPMNPIGVTAITRSCLFDAFFIIRHVPSIRLKSRIVRTLPALVQASARTITAYSAAFMDIVMHVIEQHGQEMKFENFLEEEAYNVFMMGIIDTLALLAPIDPEQVAKHGEVLVGFHCDFLLKSSMRSLTLSILNLMFTLLSSPASSTVYRSQVPLILSTCSTFLANTRSRKSRMACLKVIGAIGVIEVHQRPPPSSTQAPENIDDSLARQFFHPSRDLENGSDETMLISDSPVDSEQYFTSVAAASLMKIFNDDTLKEFYVEAVQALVTILSEPKMRMLSSFDQFVARLLTVLENSTDAQMATLLPHYARLIANSSHNTSPFLERSLRLIIDRFCESLQFPLIELIIAFLKALRDGFAKYASQTICLLIGCLDSSKISSLKISSRVLRAFSLVGIYAADLLYLIVPQICDAIECEQTLPLVRIEALSTLAFLASSVNLLPYLGPVMRGLAVGINSKEPQCQRAAMELLSNLLETHGAMFLKHSRPILRLVEQRGISDHQLHQVIEKINSGDTSIRVCTPRQQSVTRYWTQPVTGRKFQFSEDAVTTRAMTPNLGMGRHLTEWLRSFMLAVISNSPSTSIRACTTLATSHYPLAVELFNSAFYSCWVKMSPKAKNQIVESFRDLLVAKENYDTVARDLINLLVFMHKIEKPLDISGPDLVSSCLRYGGAAFALRLQEEAIDANPNDMNVISSLIAIYVQLGDWDNAIGVWKLSQMKSSALNKLEVLASLKMWDQVHTVYKERFEKKNDYQSFLGLSMSLAAMALWPELMSYVNVFKKLKLHEKRSVAQCFAEAALHLGNWDILDEALKNAPDDSTRCNALSALNALHKNRFADVDQYVQKGFSLIASRPITFWADNQQIHRDTMLACQELVEILEMKQWKQGKHMKEEEDVWSERLKTAPRDFDLWFGIIANRGSIIQVRDENLIKFFQLKSGTVSAKVHTNAFDILFPNYDHSNAPMLHKICWAIAKWNIGEKQVAIDEMAKLAEGTGTRISSRCHFFYASWLMETNDSLEAMQTAFDHLKLLVNFDSKQTDSSDDVRASKRSMKALSSYVSTLMLPAPIVKEMMGDTTNVEVLRKWCDVNVALIPLDNANLAMYVTNAIDALTQCAKLAPSFPDVVQLLNLFFEHANLEKVFSSTAHTCIKKLQPKLLLQASPQLLVQLNHQTPEVAQFVHDVVLQLLLEHYHELIFSLIVQTKSKNLSRAKAAQMILDEFQTLQSAIYDEVRLIRRCLLIATVTWNEKVIQKIGDALDHYQRGSFEMMSGCLRSIVDLVKKKRGYDCEMHQYFKEKFGANISTLEGYLSVFNPKVKTNLDQVYAWCTNMQDLVTTELKRIHTIQLSSISPELCRKTDFYLAVPGTYKPGRPPIRIKYFVGQFSVYMTKQQPKDVVVKGEDGNFYQYLLKGHEDLRLDERIMQFFRVINSLVAKETFFHSNIIRTVTVIPFSLTHGLVQWVPGTETMRNVVEQVRKLHKREPMDEYGRAELYSTPSFDWLQPFQKQHIIEKIFREVPDTDIANFFWIKAPNAETWLKQIDTFATTTAMTSIVGYVIGLGDRHPSNLLIDRFTGRVVHIDFGDCFEKAAQRKMLPEVVPFRLTRMMVKALGASGVNGLFMTSFINMSSLLRENHRVLIMVLAVFVQEPLIDPDEEPIQGVPVLSKATTGSIINKDRVYMTDDHHVASSIELRRRVQQKLTGTDFEEGVQLSVEEQAKKLIDMATDIYSLSKMYSGWCPFW